MVSDSNNYLSVRLSSWNAKSIIYLLCSNRWCSRIFFRRREGIDDDDAKAGDEVEENQEKSDFDINSVKDNSKISLNIGYGLVSLVSQNDVDSLVPSITKLKEVF